jgi:AcrR family transcriptional regulator
MAVVAVKTQQSGQKLKETRQRILDAAEALFVEHGFEATSTRMVTGAAQVNLAAVNYHFGSKEDLMREVLRRRMASLNEEWLRALDEAEVKAKAKGTLVKPSVIVDGFFGTPLRIAAQMAPAEGRTFLNLVGRTMTEPSAFIRTFLATEYAKVLERYKKALFKALPGVPRAEIVWRFHFMLGATSYAIAGTDSVQLVADWQMAAGEDLAADEKLLPRLMAFLLGGLRSPLPQH